MVKRPDLKVQVVVPAAGLCGDWSVLRVTDPDFVEKVSHFEQLSAVSSLRSQHQ